MPTPFTIYNGGSNATLVNALLAANSGIEITAGSILLDASGPSAVNYYDGSLAPLGIGAGLLLTSGTTPGTANTAPWFGTDNSGSSGFNNGNASINAVVNTVFNTVSYDATTLAFEFTVLDPTATSISFDLVFGSDEYPEWVDQFVDCATVMVNGVNYALFNHDPMHPLSVVSGNLAAGYFINNAGSVLPIEYDGVSHVLKIVAPIHTGSNKIEIGIADTGDHIYDSGLFIANFSAGNIPGSGIVVDSPTSGTDNSDTLSGTSQSEYFDCKDGDDSVYAGGGDDIIVAGGGNDSVYAGSGDDDMEGDAGDDYLDGGEGLDTAVYVGASSEYSLSLNSQTAAYLLVDSKSGAASEGSDSLINVEYAKFSDGLFQLSAAGFVPVTTSGGGNTANNPGSLVITGVGAVGNTLSAQVSDLDGVPAQVNFQWQVQDGGIWNDVGNNSSSYTVTATDAGLSIRVIASYTDAASNIEEITSVDKFIPDLNAGDLMVTLMQLQAPAGASTMNPLTTLIQAAIELGISPNLAATQVKNVFGLDAGINLLHFDSWAALQADPFDPVALEVEMIAVQTAILTSLSDDDTGVNLALAVVNAAQNGLTLDLADAHDLADILGIDITGISNKNLYPQPLREIFDRNKTMADAIADGDGVDAIEQEWLDLLSIQDNIASTSIADLSIHINQAPVGTATASLSDGAVGTSYLIQAADLLTGFSDPEGDTLTVVGLNADQGNLISTGGNAWTYTPAAGFKGGPVELNYQVSDGNGGVTSGSQIFVLAAANHAPTLDLPIADQQAACKSLFVYAIPDGTFSDLDVGDTLILSATLADGSPLPKWLSFNVATGTFTGTPAVAHIGMLEIMMTATDAAGASVADTFILDVASLIQGGANDDILRGTWGNDLLFGFDGNDRLIGNSGADYLDAGMGDDVLNGGLGADTMLGGIGNDIYWVDDVNDVVVEYADEGTDRVYAAIDYTLGNALENLTLTGTDNISGTGNELNNHLLGNAGNNQLNGGLGNDNLNGGLGADTMTGGDGDDKYWVDDVGDVIVEFANDGTDRVFATIDYTLGSTLENLTLTGSSNTTGTGNDLQNRLIGNAGDNALHGGLGNDYLTGGAGSDLLDGGEGRDQASYAASASAVRINLEAGSATGGDAEGDVLNSIENLAGSAWDDELIGNALANFLAGRDGNDVLMGEDGNDVLVGGLGNDTLAGGAGKDNFRFADLLDANENMDTILDFNFKDDTIQLGLNVFDAIGGTGKLYANHFSNTGVAMDADDYIVYDKTSGSLSYDSDGNGAALGILFAQLGANTQVEAGNFNLI